MGTDQLRTPFLTAKYARRLDKGPIVSLKISFHDRFFLVLIPERNQKSVFHGSLKIPQDSEIIVLQFISEELDSAWAASENSIVRYG